MEATKSVKIDELTHRALKIASAGSGRTLSDILFELVKRFLPKVVKP